MKRDKSKSGLQKDPMLYLKHQNEVVVYNQEEEDSYEDQMLQQRAQHYYEA